jgi:hypothetical protein
VRRQRCRLGHGRQVGGVGGGGAIKGVEEEEESGGGRSRHGEAEEKEVDVSVWWRKKTRLTKRRGVTRSPRSHLERPYKNLIAPLLHN